MLVSELLQNLHSGHYYC